MAVMVPEFRIAAEDPEPSRLPMRFRSSFACNPEFSEGQWSAMANDDKAKAAQGSPAKAKRPGLDRSVQTHIGRKLRSVYHSFAAEPVPDRITQLLQRLEAGGQPSPAAEAPAAEADTAKPGSSSE